MIRHDLVYRRECFVMGLQAAGYKVVDQLPHPTAEDVLVIWNRYGTAATTARKFEAAGARVLVCENGYLTKNWLGENWIAISFGHHAGAGQWRVGSPARWDSLGVELEPFRYRDGEIVIFEQRGFGEEGIAAPNHWAENAQARYGGRIRPHPQGFEPATPLAVDLCNASACLTWNSGAALRALMLGVPVWHEFPKWIGAHAAKPLDRFGKEAANRDDAARLAMFRHLAWAMWRLREISTGEPFTWLLQDEKVAA
jgi:hypothetical protein